MDGARELPARLVHRAVVAHLGRAHVGIGGQAGALAILDVGEPRRLPRPRGLDAAPDGCQRLAPAFVRELLERHAWHRDVDVDAVGQRAGESPAQRGGG